MKNNQKLLLFAGTTEGRELAEYLAAGPAHVDICVATEYGEKLLPDSPFFRIFQERMDRARMTELMLAESYDLVLDATHPYAAEVTANIKKAAAEAGITLKRVLRQGIGDDRGASAENIPDALKILESSSGPIFLSTGSKNLPEFMTLPHASERIFVRILPSSEVLASCLKTGLPASHIFCMQGPFDTDMNVATLKHIEKIWKKKHQDDKDAAALPITLVTKQSGAAGGYDEKLLAAEMVGAKVLTIGVPKGTSVTQDTCILSPEKTSASHDTGILSPEETYIFLASELGLSKPRPQVALIGMGMSGKQLTRQAQELLRDCHMIIGAGRMLGEVSAYNKPTMKSYNYDEIADVIMHHPIYSRFCVLFSGDIGFYSGAASLRSKLENENVDLISVSGISSPAHFMNLLGKSWEDTPFISCHGKEASVISRLRHHGRLVALLGKPGDVAEICHKLIDYHMEETFVCIGSELGLENESIVKGSPADFIDRDFPALSVIYLEKADQISLQGGLPDDVFVRGKVPMTKSEVRSIILAKLAPQKDSVIYDIGAGTGSIAIEAARLAPESQVYAIERNEEGIHLIRENAYGLGTDNLSIIQGIAPEALKDLPAPTHAFIGGSGGHIEEIIRLLYEKNPKVRIVISAIALETVGEITKLIKTLSAEMSESDSHWQPEMIQVQINRSRKAGPYHLMEGQNPIYVITLPERM